MKQYKSNIPKYTLKKMPSNIKKEKIESSDDSAKYIRQFYHDDIEISIKTRPMIRDGYYEELKLELPEIKKLKIYDKSIVIYIC
jgi:hypothetical protein